MRGASRATPYCRAITNPMAPVLIQGLSSGTMETSGPDYRAPKSACRAIWNWDSPTVTADPISGQLRRRGIVRSSIGMVVAACMFALGFQIGAMVAGSVAVVVLVTSICSPERGYRAIESTLDRLGYAVGVLLSWLLLVPIFVGFFVPCRLLLRRGRRNPILHRREGSSWVPREHSVRSAADYERQF